jgi:hypothetical protein
MGRLYDTAGDEVTATELTAMLTEVTQPSKWTIDQDVFEDKNLPGSAKHTRVLKFTEGSTITQAQVDNAFVEGTIDTIAPATGGTTGGTVITITGTGLSEATGVTVGGAAATAFSVLSDTQIRCTTPAGTAGAKNVVVLLDAGNVTETNGFTYA